MNEHEKIKPTPRGFTGFLSSTVKMVFWGIFFGVIVNSFMWYQKGYEGTLLDLDRTYESQMSAIDLRSNTVSAYIEAAFSVASKWTQSLITKGKKISQIIPFYNDVSGELAKITLINDLANKISNAIILLSEIIKVIIAKFFSLFMSIWILIFASMTGAIDGLMSRYVRTSEGGRESTWVFHRISDLIIKVPVNIIFFYLVVPLILDPEYVVIAMSLLFFSFFYVLTANLKKFL